MNLKNKNLVAEVSLLELRCNAFNMAIDLLENVVCDEEVSPIIDELKKIYLVNWASAKSVIKRTETPNAAKLRQVREEISALLAERKVGNK